MIEVTLQHVSNGNKIKKELPFIPNIGTWIFYDEIELGNLPSHYLTVERVIIEKDNSIRILVDPD